MVSRYVRPNISLNITPGFTRTSRTNHPLQFGLFAALLVCGVALLSAPSTAQSTDSSCSDYLEWPGGIRADASLARSEPT